MMSNATKSFDILATSSSILHNCLDSSIKFYDFFLDLYLLKFFNTSVKSFFPCTSKNNAQKVMRRYVSLTDSFIKSVIFSFHSQISRNHE